VGPDGVYTIGVLGVGTMGAGIVQLAAQTSHEVVAYAAHVEAIERAQCYVRDGLSRFVRQGTFASPGRRTWSGSVEKSLEQQWLAARGTFPIQQSAELEGAYLVTAELH
jgi:3-hydroxybutyryl-CoA dehydrogenase